MNGATDLAAANNARPARHAVEPSIGSLVADAHASFSALLHGEIELAKLELKTSVTKGGMGIALFAAAGVIALLSLPFIFVAFAEGLVSAGLWRWLSYLIVWAIFMVTAGLLGFLGFRSIKKVRPPKDTIDTTMSTVEALKTATRKP